MGTTSTRNKVRYSEHATKVKPERWLQAQGEQKHRLMVGPARQRHGFKRRREGEGLSRSPQSVAELSALRRSVGWMPQRVDTLRPHTAQRCRPCACNQAAGTDPAREAGQVVVDVMSHGSYTGPTRTAGRISEPLTGQCTRGGAESTCMEGLRARRLAGRSPPTGVPGSGPG